MNGTETKTYWRTAFGDHRHQSWVCANNRRAITSGDVIQVTEAEMASLPPCEVCTGDEVTEWNRDRAAAPARKRCANSGVANPRHIESECRDCGKRGRVNRSTGTLGPHAPAEPKKEMDL